ncbi:MAG: hypothetical protein F4Y28_10185 [Acidimicrobiia bacterium]|nr:hypothetical protein [Acidimicrobiia bacterium]MYG57772.1 hypothetical protein [Acidimicrobiia bacterium]MYJ33367.1 hypothetical protein [Acidimicrobiia bacterium]
MTWRTRLRWPRWAVLVAVLGLLAAATSFVPTAAQGVNSGDSTEQFGRVPSKDITVQLDSTLSLWGTIDDVGNDDVLWVLGYNLHLDDGGWVEASSRYSYDLTDGTQFGRTLSGSAFNDSGVDRSGLWSDGTTAWLLRDDTAPDGAPIQGRNKIFAYTLSDWARDSSKDITLQAENDDPMGLWSDGTTIYTTDTVDKKVYAYTLYTTDENDNQVFSGANDSTKEFNLFDGGTSTYSDGNALPGGLWSNGTTMWVTDGDRSVYAYTLATGAYDSAKTFSASISITIPPSPTRPLGAQTHVTPHGIWSDGTTVWISDTVDGNVYAFNLTGNPPVGGV